MHVEKAASDAVKGWMIGPWDASVNITAGAGSQGVAEPHFHHKMTEIFVVVHGTVVMRVDNKTVMLAEDDVIAIEPGEIHSLVAYSPDYRYFVIQTPALLGEAARADHAWVSSPRLHR